MQMSAHRISRKFVLLAGLACLVVAAPFGGYALVGSHGRPSPTLARASGHDAAHTCAASGKLAGTSKCPAKSDPAAGIAHRSGQSPGPSPSSSSGSPKASSSPSHSPSPGSSSGSSGGSSATGAACVTAGLSGTCGPYTDPSITDADGFNTDVANNMWGCGAVQPGQPGAYCGVETVTANGPADWSVTSNQKAGNTGVLSYPDVAQVFTLSSDTDPPISAFSSVTSSFAETMNATAGTDAEAAYDIWADNGSAVEEIMIWVDNHGQTPAGNDTKSVTIGGTTYEFWNAGDTVSFVRSNEQSGTVDILAVLHWLQSNGYLSASADLGQVDFGWEICSTGGVPETFTVSGYTLVDTCSSVCTG
jgi:hypothetical protein